MRTLTESERQLISDSGLFDAAWYSEKYPDVGMVGLDPLEHFLRIGIHMGRDPGPLFCSQFYASQEESSKSKDCLLLDYLTTGWREKIKPHPLFNTTWYLAAYPDVQAQNVEPLQHFIKFGSKEGRNPNLHLR